MWLLIILHNYRMFWIFKCLCVCSFLLFVFSSFAFVSVLIFSHFFCYIFIFYLFTQKITEYWATLLFYNCLVLRSVIKLFNIFNHLSINAVFIANISVNITHAVNNMSDLDSIFGKVGHLQSLFFFSCNSTAMKCNLTKYI